MTRYLNIGGIKYMIKTMQEFKEKTKGLSQEKANEFLNNLSEEEQELIKCWLF